MKRNIVGVVVLCSSTVLLVSCSADCEAAAGGDTSLARTREQVRMLDDLYKTAVVLITEHYVATPSTLSAATAAKALFAEMEKKGRHQVRLLGFTEALMNPANAPADAFEKAAAAALLAGEGSHEEVVTEAGRRYLRYATPLPVVMEKCLMCHPTWQGNTGSIGSLSYKVALID